jgi:hypothetical protein
VYIGNAVIAARVAAATVDTAAESGGVADADDDGSGGRGDVGRGGGRGGEVSVCAVKCEPSSMRRCL